MKSVFAITCLSLLFAPAVSLQFNALHHSGAASPYFDAPSQFGISDKIPEGCSVEQAAYIVRHGSRFPEPGSYTGWLELFAKFQNSSYTARGPLAFIPSWTPPVDDVPHEPLFLSSTGAGEAFDLGVQLRKRYGLTKGGENLTVWSAGQQRVVDTASYFLKGYLSAGNYLTAPNENRGSIVVMPDSVNWTFADSLTPSAACPLYATGDTHGKADIFRETYQSKIAERLNQYLDGLTLNSTDIGPMQDLCGFQAEVNGDTCFCDIFTEDEWEDYEYAHDLNYYYGSGPGNPFSAVVGFPYVKAVTALLTVGPNKTTSDATFTPPPLIMSFTHDNNLPPIISALGLWNTSARGVYPLSVQKPNPFRKFRSSYLVAFRGYVALERLSCDDEPHDHAVKHSANKLVPGPGRDTASSKYVRIRINNAVVPMPGCVSGPGSTCPLQAFVQLITQDRAAASGDFVTVCGLRSVSNATSEADFFTRVPSTNAQSTVLELDLP